MWITGGGLGQEGCAGHGDGSLLPSRRVRPEPPLPPAGLPQVSWEMPALDQAGHGSCGASLAWAGPVTSSPAEGGTGVVLAATAASPTLTQSADSGGNADPEELRDSLNIIESLIAQD